MELRQFERFVADARPRLWRAFVPVRGLDGADEAVAEALAWAAGNRHRLTELTNPVGYLYRVGLTRSIPPAQPTTLPAPADVAIPDIEPRLIPALLALTEHQRTAVWLVHACGWTYDDVATAMEIGRSTVGTHVARGLDGLRTRLEDLNHV